MKKKGKATGALRNTRRRVVVLLDTALAVHIKTLAVEQNVSVQSLVSKALAEKFK